MTGADPDRDMEALRFQAAGITVLIDEARKPGAKWMALLRIGLDDTPLSIGVLPVTTSTAGFGKAEKALLALLRDHGRTLDEGEARDVRNLLRRVLDPAVLGRAAEILAERAAASEPTGPTMVEVASEWLGVEVEPAFVGTRGAVWSERLRRSVTAGEVGRLVCSDLVEALSAARDFAAPTGRDPLKPFRAARIALAAAWTNLTRRLPDEVRADHLGPETAAARALWNKLVEIWSHAETFVKTIDAEGKQVVQRSSLAGRVRHLVEAQRPGAHRGGRGEWHRVLSGVGAYYVATVDPVRPKVHIGMRYTLLRQLQRVRVEGPRNQRDFEHLLQRYGLAAPGEEVRHRRGRHGEAIAVLRLDLSEHVVWGADGQENGDAQSAPPAPGTESAVDAPGPDRAAPETGGVVGDA